MKTKRGTPRVSLLTAQQFSNVCSEIGAMNETMDQSPA